MLVKQYYSDDSLFITIYLFSSILDFIKVEWSIDKKPPVLSVVRTVFLKVTYSLHKCGERYYAK